MFAFSMGALSGPAMTPRMTSTPCAAACADISTMATSAATTIEEMRRDTDWRDGGSARDRRQSRVGQLMEGKRGPWGRTGVGRRSFGGNPSYLQYRHVFGWGAG